MLINGNIKVFKNSCDYKCLKFSSGLTGHYNDYWCMSNKKLCKYNIPFNKQLLSINFCIHFGNVALTEVIWFW